MDVRGSFLFADQALTHQILSIFLLARKDPFDWCSQAKPKPFLSNFNPLTL